MKKLILCLILSLFAMAGCSKSEDTETTTADASPPPPVTREAVETEESDTTEPMVGPNALIPTTDPINVTVPTREDAEKALSSNLNWNNFSWEEVSQVPYDDKAQLAAWASNQVDQWKGKLADAAKTQGLSMLSNLGDSGWQGALKDVVDAIQGIKEANPETWEMARGALVSSWENFEDQAAQYLEN